MVNDIESICSWFKYHEAYILQNGSLLPLSLSKYLVSLESQYLIQVVKKLYVDEIPLPKELHQYSEFKHKPRGLAVGNGIYIDKKYKGDEILLKHEIIHVIQYNRFDSIDSFIKQYIKEYLQYGYIEMPLEKEARIKSIKRTP